MTILKKVKDGWINIEHEDLFYQKGAPMILQERKSKYKHKIIMTRQIPDDWTTPKVNPEIHAWCESTFGPGGRKYRWRFGWTHKDSTFYFRSSKDAMMFTLRWAS